MEKKKALKAFALSFGAVAAAMAAGSEFAYKKAFYVPPAEKDADYHILSGEQYDKYKELNVAQITKLRERPFDEVHIKSFDGLDLYGRWYFQGADAPTAICMHGWHGTAFRDFCGGANELLDMGFNVLLPDQRGHMNSQGKSLSFGIHERFDCKDWAWYVFEELLPELEDGSRAPMYLYGISMGASTVLMASSLDLPPNICGIVADCPYSSPKEIIKLHR